MSSRRSAYFWLNNDASIPNPFQNMEDPTRTFNRIRDDSMSLFARYDDSKNILNFMILDENANDKDTAKKSFNFLDVINQQS